MKNERHNINDEAFETVFDVLSEMMLKPKDKLYRELSLSDRLVKDLELDSDDLSFIFIPRLEDWVGTAIHQKDWEQVWCIEDAINLVVNYKQQMRPTSSTPSVLEPSKA
jgi:acyl carrier protein